MNDKASSKQKQLTIKIVLYVILVIIAVFYLTPAYVMTVTSLKEFEEVNLNTMWDLPSGFSIDSFIKAWAGESSKGTMGLGGNFMNSLMLVIPATIISCFIGSINGYIFSKWKFPYSDIVFMFFLFGMFIPYQSVLIPLVQVLQSLKIFNLYGSIAGLILVHVIYGIPITTLIFRNYYDGIHSELIESGRIDGANVVSIYTKIIFPISIPAFVVAIIWQFTSIWNEFLFATTLTSKPSVQPMTVALNNLSGSFVVEWNVQMAGALLTALPPLLLYIFLQKYFIRGLLSGSVKG